MVDLTDTCRYDKDKGKHFYVDSKMPSQKWCNSRGKFMKAFDPNLTGKFNYEKRLRIMRD